MSHPKPHPPTYYVPPDAFVDGAWITSRVVGPFKGEPGARAREAAARLRHKTGHRPHLGR